MVWPPEELKAVAEQVHSGTAFRCTVRELLRWYGYERRGRFIVWVIRRDLEDFKLRTDPDIEYPYIDGQLTVEQLSPQPADPPETATETQTAVVSSEPEDPTHRIGRLPSANARPVAVNPNATVAEAVTLMLLNDYSQLPVMQGERGLKGAVTWQSIGSRLALRQLCNTVQDCIEDAVVVESSASLFSAIPAVVERGFVLVRDHESAISGIVTTTDLSLQFRQLAEPFLLLGEIEKHLRRLIDGRFTLEELGAAKDPSDDSRQVRDASDLTFGEHIRLLEKPERWSALNLTVDRGTFVKRLNEVREIRNDVMHFDPDGTEPSELEKLRQFVRLLDAIAS